MKARTPRWSSMASRRKEARWQGQYAVELLAAGPGTVDWEWLETASALEVAAWWAGERRQPPEPRLTIDSARGFCYAAVTTR
jgi:hypothetical protein